MSAAGPPLGAGDCEARRPGALGQPTNTVTSGAYLVGAVWLAVQSGLSAGEAITAGVLPFVPFDVVKVVLAALLAAAVAPQISALGAPRRSV